MSFGSIKTGRLTTIESGKYPQVLIGLDANKTSNPVMGDIYIASDTEIFYVCFVVGTWLDLVVPATRKKIDDLLIRFTNIGKITDSAGAIKTSTHTTYGRQIETPAIGDFVYLYFFCDGTETQLNISTSKALDCAKWDLYLNGALDSTGYDDYNASGIIVQHRVIILTDPVLVGRNIIKLKATTKNGSSVNYNIQIISALIQ